TVINPGTLRLGIGSSGGTEPLTLGGAGGGTKRGALHLNDNSPTWNGDITLSTTAVGVRVDNGIPPTPALHVTGRIHGVGTGLTKVGAGTLVFAGSGVNDYTGTTLVDEGLLSLVKIAEINAINAVSGPLVIGQGVRNAQVRLLANNQIANT